MGSEGTADRYAGLRPAPKRRNDAMPARFFVVAVAVILSGNAQTEEAGPLTALTCQVSGYDVILINGGTEPIAVGTEVKWSVPFARQEGTHTLEKDLEPGSMAFLSGALGSSFLDSSTPCEIGQDEADEEAQAPVGED